MGNAPPPGYADQECRTCPQLLYESLVCGRQSARGKMSQATRTPDHGPYIHRDQAVSPMKYTPLMLPQTVVRSDLVDEDERDALADYLVGHRVPVHRQDRHPLPLFLTDCDPSPSEQDGCHFGERPLVSWLKSRQAGVDQSRWTDDTRPKLASMSHR